MTKIKNIAKYSAIITAVLILSKFMGAFREILIAAQFGANREADIFKTATRIPQLFYGCIGAALTTTFIPIFSNVKENREKANEFFNNILNIMCIICVILSFIGIIFSTQLTELMVKNFENEALLRTARMSIIVMPSIIFLALSGLFTGYLQSYGKFLQPALTGISADFVVIFAVLVFAKYGIISAIIAFLISSAVQMLIQRPFMGDYKYKFYINFKDSNVRKMLILAIPTLISTAASQINVMVDSTFASGLPAGSIAIVSYADRVSSIINQVFIVSLTTVFYPMLTEKYSQNDHEGFQDLFKKSVNMIIMVAVPLVFGVAVLGEPVVKILFEHKNFTRDATLTTASCLRFLAFSSLGYSLMDILGKVFFSIKDTVTPMVNGFIMIILNIILIITLVPKLGIIGLVLATTISANVMAVVLFVEIKIKLKNIDFVPIFKMFAKTLVSGVVMAVIISVIYMIINVANPMDSIIATSIKLILIVAIGAVSYGLMLLVLRVEEVNSLVALKFKRKRV